MYSTPLRSYCPITTGIENGDIWGPTDVYGVRMPLPGDSKLIVLGQVINRKDEFDENDPFFGMKKTDDEIATENPESEELGNPNDPMMPVAWTKSYQLPIYLKLLILTYLLGNRASPKVNHLFFQFFQNTFIRVFIFYLNLNYFNQNRFY